MPAPVPIQIRYGPAGLLAQAVAQAGANQGNAERDFSFINSQMASRDRMAQEYAQQNQSANQLQQAYAMHTGQQQQQAPDFYNAGNDANASLLKQTYLQSAASDIPEAEKANLTMLAKARNISPEQFRLAVGDAAKRGNTNTNEDADAASKKAYVDSILPNLPAEDQAGLISLAKDRRTTAAQLRSAGDAVIQRAALSNRVQTAQQIQAIDIQSHMIKHHLEAMSRESAKAGVDIYSANPASTNPTYRDATQGVGSGDASSGFFNRAADKLLAGAGGTLVTPSKSKINVQQLIAFQRLQNELASLQAKRDELSGGGGGVQQPPQQQQPAADPLGIR